MTFKLAFLALVVFVQSGSNTPSPENPMSDLSYIDHIILSIDDLDRGMDQLEQATGVRPVFGGVHPGRGTQNALLSLGNKQYIELLAPNLKDTSAAVQQFAERIKSNFARFPKPTPDGWAIGVADADAERAKMIAKGFKSSDVHAGSRNKPDGQTLRWKTFDPWGTEEDHLPFVIEWSSASAHPATSSPGGCTLVDFSMESTAVDSARAMFARAGYPLKITAGPRDKLSATIDCPKGRVTF